jgi:electron transport complex protein RnfE
MGLGFTLVLVVLGGIREIIGSGTLFSNASLLLGPAFGFLEITVIPNYRGLLLFILPPGGFLVLSALLAIQQKIKLRAENKKATVVSGGESCA